MKTFGQFFDLLVERLLLARHSAYQITHEFPKEKTAVEWQELRDSPLSEESFDSLARKQMEDLNVNAAFIPSDSAYEEVHDETVARIRTMMEVARECGLEHVTDWTNRHVGSPVLEKMRRDRQEEAKPFSCAVFRIAKATASGFNDIFIELWQTPEEKIKKGYWPQCECVGVVGGETREEVLEKLKSFRHEHKVVVTAPWPKVGPAYYQREAVPA